MAGVMAFDPGLTGGVAAWENSFVDPILCALPMPRSGKGLDERAIAELIAINRPELIVIERVSNMLAEDKNGDRTRRNGASSMFTFGVGYGVLRGLARSYQVLSESAHWPVRIDYPLPQQWKQVILPGAGRGKQGAIDYCKLHFPEVNLITKGCQKEHTGMVDALCLLRYGQKLLEKKRNDRSY